MSDAHAVIDARLAAAARPRRLARRAFAFRQGERARAVFFVVEGEVQLCRVGRRGERIILHRARPGEWFAEAALWSGRYHCDAVAARAAQLLEIPAARLQVAPIALQATLQEALETMDASGAEALTVTTQTGADSARIYGVLRRSDIERSYRYG